MKKIFILVILFSNIVTIAQSKKEQIITLENRVDSFRLALSNEIELNNKNSITLNSRVDSFRLALSSETKAKLKNEKRNALEIIDLNNEIREKSLLVERIKKENSDFEKELLSKGKLITILQSEIENNKLKIDSLEAEIKYGASSFKVLDVSKYNPEKLPHQGQISFKRIWHDLNGENIVLFTLKNYELFVYHYVIKNDIVRQLRKVYDIEADCEYDLSLYFIDSSIVISDLDQDNYGEITFAYRKACRSDVSSSTMKLLTLENGEKYIIRGTTKISLPGYSEESQKKIDPSFYNAPHPFLTNANRIWQANIID
ncbi:MAG: M949_RS01915 family surface polysaccharide biosynthesis protein [Bacteroidia bacterium]|jgi:hypothetical protein